MYTQLHFEVYSLKFIVLGNVGYYIFVLVAIMVAFIVVKKVASCMIKSAILIALIVILAAVYWLYYM